MCDIYNKHQSSIRGRLRISEVAYITISLALSLSQMDFLDLHMIGEFLKSQ